MQLYNIAFSGHRKIPEYDLPNVDFGLTQVLAMGYQKKPVVYHTGGAAGFDSMVFKRVSDHPAAINILHIPFQYQWLALQKFLNKSASEITDYLASLCPICGPVPHDPRMDRDLIYLYQKRNEHMVDAANELIYYWDGIETGGTWNTIKYARKVGVPMRDIREL